MNDPTGIVAAANVAAGGKPPKSDSDILTTARARLDMAVSALAEAAKTKLTICAFMLDLPTITGSGLLTCWPLAARCKVRRSTPARR
jgi:hypothetical protein